MKLKQSPKDYGYRVDISKPPFSELYKRFKRYKGIPQQIPCSDGERAEFEAWVLGEKKKGEQT